MPSDDPSNTVPRVSIILLDWSVREHFQALHYLQNQTVPREDYELIWVELYDEAADIAKRRADTVITMYQTGNYHKHKGYNAGLLQARGDVVCICDSDAVFPENFVESILNAFQMSHGANPISLILMHYQWRTNTKYPIGYHPTLDEVKAAEWKPLWENVGACMTVRVEDAIRYGGFDEHRGYRGYMCGPYDLGWRLINAGVPELWHDPTVALWHYAHPDPTGTTQEYTTFQLWRETANLHIQGHALPAVEHFSSGRMLPREENIDIFHRRMSKRVIGSSLEEAYASLTGPVGFSWKDRIRFGVDTLRTIRRVRSVAPLFSLMRVIKLMFLTLVALFAGTIADENHSAKIMRYTRFAKVLGWMGIHLVQPAIERTDHPLTVGYYRRRKMVQLHSTIYVSPIRPWIYAEEYLSGQGNFKIADNLDQAHKIIDEELGA